MRPKVNSNRFEISLWGKILFCFIICVHVNSGEVNLLECKSHFGQFDQSEVSNHSEFSMQTVNTCKEIKLHNRII